MRRAALRFGTRAPRMASSVGLACRYGAPTMRFNAVNDRVNSPAVSMEFCSTAKSPANLTNGKFLNYAMLYHDSVAFLLCNDLGIPHWMSTQERVTPMQVADRFNLSCRAASAFLVTLCRMDVVKVIEDDENSVDEIEYGLTSSAHMFLSDRSSAAVTSPFIDTFNTNFITPQRLLDCSRRVEQTDIMSEHLAQDDDAVANNARHFMKHMNAQSYSCAQALPRALGLDDNSEPTVLLDVGGGSAIYPIFAAKQSAHLTGIVYELPGIKPITEEYIAEAGLSDRILVEAGDFFTADPFPSRVDLVLFANILHDWPDEINMQLLRKAYDCLNPGGRVVISELLLADDVKSSTSSATSMNVIMIPYTKGRQYRPKELFRRLSKLGFVAPTTTALVDDYSLIVARKPHK